MKQIAIMNCLQANDVCSGAGCLNALYERRGGFAVYQDEPVRLRAFLRCSTCGKTPEQDAGMTEKLERLMSMGVETVHIGVCAQPKGVKCPYMQENARWLQERGVEIIWQTH